MPRETVGINLHTVPTYEAGAVFLACLAHPGRNEEQDRQRLWVALCRQTLIHMANQDGDWAWQPHPIKPGFFIIGDQTAEKTIKRGFQRLEERLVAAHYYLMPLVKQLLVEQELRVEGFLPTVDSMAMLAAAQLGWSQGHSANVKSRVFNPSKPVIHAAAAIQVSLHILNRKYPDAASTVAANYPIGSFNAGMLLSWKELLEHIVLESERIRLCLPLLKRVKIAEDETIQFQLG
jgi:hypothetical protein